MKFREYDNIFPKVLVSTSKEDLERQITDYATKYNMIDLQYSTTTVEMPIKDGTLKTGFHISSRQAVEYSALMLLQEKKPVKKEKKLLNEGAKNEVSD